MKLSNLTLAARENTSTARKDRGEPCRRSSTSNTWHSQFLFQEEVGARSFHAVMFVWLRGRISARLLNSDSYYVPSSPRAICMCDDNNQTMMRSTRVKACYWTSSCPRVICLYPVTFGQSEHESLCGQWSYRSFQVCSLGIKGREWVVGPFLLPQ